MATKAGDTTNFRRKVIKKTGKKLFRGGLLRFLSQQSLIPDEPVIDNKHFAWAEDLRAKWPTIQAELDKLLERRDALPSFQEISPDQAKISTDNRWKTFMLFAFGQQLDFGAEMCPETSNALASIPGISNAFFSVLGPGKHIPRHRGVTKGLVRCHLGLRIPEDREERCRIEVDGQPCIWREGEMFFFDDTYKHEVWNETDSERAVLLFDIERPMRAPGRAVSRAMIAALKRTAYYKDALANQAEWEKRYRQATATDGG